MRIEDVQPDGNKIYMYCGMNQGDTFITLNLRKKLEEKYQSELVFIVRTEHEYVAKLVGDENYIVVDVDDNIFESTLRNLISKCREPERGKIFVVNFWLYDNFKNSGTVRGLYNRFFGLPEDSYLTYNVIPPEMDEALKEKIAKTLSSRKIVMICPETDCPDPMDIGFWQEIVEKLKVEGYEVVSKVKVKEDALEGTVYLGMNDSEALQLAYNCHAVYALRNDFCNLCVGLRYKLKVYYSIRNLYNAFSFKNNYDIHDIEEIIIRDEYYET